jgi:hypothetical protein
MTHVMRGAWINLLFTMSDNTRAFAPVFRRAICRERADLMFLAKRFLRTSLRHWRRRPRSKPPGGARRDRTDDLLLAKQALSQLSYGPLFRARLLQPARPAFAEASAGNLHSLRERRLVGLGRFELPTSRLSSARSNQLSYKPGPDVNDQQPVIRNTSHLITEY